MLEMPHSHRTHAHTYLRTLFAGRCSLAKITVLVFVNVSNAILERCCGHAFSEHMDDMSWFHFAVAVFGGSQ